MSQLSAADLQKKHQLEGAPDPFPSLSGEVKSAPETRANGSLSNELDTHSQQAFPSLTSTSGSANGNAASASAWSATKPRIQPAAKLPLHTDHFSIHAVDSVTRDGKSLSSGDVMKQVMTKYKVKVEASTNRSSHQRTYYIKSESKKELDRAKRMLVSLLSPVVNITVQAPVSTIPSIIGTKGATLTQIREQTGVRVDIPPKDPNTVNGVGSHSASVEEEEEPLVPITITGAETLVAEARDLLMEIIRSKTAKSSQKVRDIPAHVFPFVLARRAAFMTAAQGADIELQRDEVAREITISGDREAVHRVADVVRSTMEAVTAAIVPYEVSLPKRQHRLLTGKVVDEIMLKSKCAVIVSSPEEMSDKVTIWGREDDVAAGFSAMMEMANSQYIHEYPLPGPITFSRQILTYMNRNSYTTTLAWDHPGVQIFTPSATLADKAESLNIEFVGDKPLVDGAIKQFSTFIGQLLGATREIKIDWLLHRVISGKYAKKIKQFYESHNVQLFFPPEEDERPLILMVYDPTSASASPSPIEKKKQLDEVEKELAQIAREIDHIKTETISVEKKWHPAIIGRRGTTLNAIIGEEKTLSIKLGKDVGDSTTEDVVLLRGVPSDVDRAAQEIHRIVASAKNDEIDNNHVVEFDVDREYVGRIVGAQGAAVNKIRDTLGVKLDFSDDVEEKEVGAKKKKAVHQKSKVKIVGRKENVEEAKRRILSQVERLADETSEVLSIPHQYHSSLIGQGGKYVIRLEERYGVKITFPREAAENGEGKTREPLKVDEVLLKGGRKGVREAKQEILDAVEFEKESNNQLKFTIPARSIARVLGKGGASINQIKDETNAQIDVDKSDDAVATISLRGTKKGINAAKTAILAIAEQVGEETTITVQIDNKYHRTIIGAGGQGLKNLIIKCGGPSDTKLQAGLIRFPRQGDPSDEVRLRGEPKLVENLKVELLKVVAELRDRVVLAISIPVSQHRALIGRGGQHLTEFQDRLGVQVQFPGSRSYAAVGEPENTAELQDADANSLVKVSGSRASCEKAVQELTAKAKTAPAQDIHETVTVPLKYQRAVLQQGNLLRNIRNTCSVSVDIGSPTPAQSQTPSTDTEAARIDDIDGGNADGVQWHLTENYKDVEEGDSVWSLRARDEAGLTKAKEMISRAVEQADKATHTGLLTFPDRTLFPRIVGSKGANVARIRAETGAEVIVGREDNYVTIIGSKTAVEDAKVAVLATGNSRRGA